MLIDEARTPLIISGQSGKSTELYKLCDILAKQLTRGEASGEFTKMNAIMGEDIEETGDFVVNEKPVATPDGPNNFFLFLIKRRRPSKRIEIGRAHV